ncbi:MAG: N(G),N(G)-dimethylarginine dimethylaminohydrolase [Anaerolineales bacterium]|nr:N(G),N(G)-dimethylarginine dimethylaminohydrolase [Chloroflexota bacterium]MBL6983803.1 N(G),N(G)-dimethylarginine dimethylaminohydrolase [Anaerolineales bacterium]
MFKNAIVRTPGRSIVDGLSSANLGKPIYEVVLEQHAAYVAAIEKCGVQVTVLDADERFPDSTFIEDTALLTPHCAIAMNLGAESRKGETTDIEQVLRQRFEIVEEVREPGTVEGGDIMMVGSHFYIGLSERTNLVGAQQVIDILEKYGLSGSMVEMNDMLHLKTGVAYLENESLVACGEFLTHPAFQDFNILPISDDESYAANSVWINGKVMIPMGYPNSKALIERSGYETIEVDVSEFRKLDGGLSCLSLRF